jgi:hypothetical protein
VCWCTSYLSPRPYIFWIVIDFLKSTLVQKGRTISRSSQSAVLIIVNMLLLLSFSCCTISNNIYIYIYIYIYISVWRNKEYFYVIKSHMINTYASHSCSANGLDSDNSEHTYTTQSRDQSHQLQITHFPVWSVQCVCERVRSINAGHVKMADVLYWYYLRRHTCMYHYTESVENYISQLFSKIYRSLRQRQL